MNMQYRKGQIVGYVPISDEFAAVPMTPACWHLLRVTPGRDVRVMRAFEERGFSGWSLTVTSVVNRKTGRDARRPHLGRKIVRPFLPGLIFIPDFELRRIDQIRAVDDVDNLLQIGTLRCWLKPEEMQLLRDIAACEGLPPSQRKLVRLAINQRVAIVDGLFAGFRALIERIDSSGRLTVYVESGKRGVKVSGLTETQIELIT
ncbi:transcription termination/antitermination protein NusG [Bradyrhizobium sp. 13971]